MGLIGSPEATETLRTLASSDPDERVRYSAVTALVRQLCPQWSAEGKCGTAEKMEKEQHLPAEDVLELLSGPHPTDLCRDLVDLYIRVMASGKGPESSAGFIERFKTQLQSDDGGKRSFAARVFGVARLKEFAPALLPLLDDQNAEVRKEAATALGLLADSATVARLTVMAREDPDEGVREASSLSLHKIKEAAPHDGT